MYHPSYAPFSYTLSRSLVNRGFDIPRPISPLPVFSPQNLTTKYNPQQIRQPNRVLHPAKVCTRPPAHYIPLFDSVYKPLDEQLAVTTRKRMFLSIPQ